MYCHLLYITIYLYIICTLYTLSIHNILLNVKIVECKNNSNTTRTILTVICISICDSFGNIDNRTSPPVLRRLSRHSDDFDNAETTPRKESYRLALSL